MIYTSANAPNSLPTLVQSTLGIQSLLKRNPLKHNVIDRERILIPPNWDSWGKIRVLREGFDPEAVSNAWSVELQGQASHAADDQRATSGVLKIFQDNVHDPQADQSPPLHNRDIDGVEAQVPSMQEFLGSQMDIIERLKAEDEAAHGGDMKHQPTFDNDALIEGTARVNEHIGPVQFNMGGVQVDADDALQKLRDRRRVDTPERELSSTTSSASISTPDGKSQNEALASFFAGLVKRGAGNSPRPTGT